MMNSILINKISINKYLTLYLPESSRTCFVFWLIYIYIYIEWPGDISISNHLIRCIKKQNIPQDAA